MTATKCFILLASLMFLTTVSCAQLRPLLKSIDEVEVIAGPSLCSMRGGAAVEEGRQLKIGYAGGIGVNYLINKNISMGLKFLFERKGLKRKLDYVYYDEENNQRDGVVEFINHFDYVTLPIVCRYSFKSILFIEGGPFIAYLLQEKSISNDLTRAIIQKYVRTENFGRIDAGFSLGLGCNLPLNSKHSINIQIVNNTGLVDVSNLDPNMFTLSVLKTSITSMVIGIKFKR